ncbi:DUF4145 domain-containing protein [Chloroflexus sp.]|uniref:DUF4145 domain-containing protein n=1 Tax=Chloroflexus sp. TaxID=1904827 RepID=UPI002ACD9015|nr:DUF4145 domain-containing protein [Chloroflexus sp.]
MEMEDDWIFCNHCKRHTHHIIRAEFGKSFSPDADPNTQVYGSGRWEIWQCKGCDAVVFRESWVVEDGSDPETGVSVSSRFFPERDERFLTRKYFHNIPALLDKLYGEVIASFNHGFNVMCAIGLRTLIEGICVDKGIMEGPNSKGEIKNNLEGKINGMKAIVPANIVDNLHGLRFMGNQAAHQLADPGQSDLILAVEITEDILNIVYSLEYKTSRLFKRMGG